MENIQIELSRSSNRAELSDELPIQEFELWRGLENAEEEITKPPEPHLNRAKSLRVEQERKVSNFLTVFGVKGGDPETQEIKTYSPQKRKRIGKVRR